MKYCLQCGHAVAPHVTACPECGFEHFSKPLAWGEAADNYNALAEELKEFSRAVIILRKALKEEARKKK